MAQQPSNPATQQPSNPATQQPSNRCFCLQMSPAPEGWEEAAADSEGFVQVYQGTERSYLAKRLVPGVQYCGRVRAINCEVRACLIAGSHCGWQ